jgi:hypothetical protein
VDEGVDDFDDEADMERGIVHLRLTVRMDEDADDEVVGDADDWVIVVGVVAVDEDVVVDDPPLLDRV